MANIDMNGIEVVMIAAADKSNVIGVSEHNEMPWRLPPFDTDEFYNGEFRRADMGLFKQVTAGSNAIMGRNTMASLGRFFPLPGIVKGIETLFPRYSTVVSRTYDKDALVQEYGLNPQKDFAVYSTLEDALKSTSPNATGAVIMGGQEMYGQGFDYADKVILTRINHSFDGDVLFPEFPSSFSLDDVFDPFKNTEYQGRVAFETYVRK